MINFWILLVYSMTNNQWDVNAELYDKGMGVDGDTFHQSIIDPVIERFLDDYKGKTILDAGCGNGYLLKKLSKDAKTVIGADFSQSMLSIAQKNTGLLKNIVYKMIDFTQPFPMESQSIDVVIANMMPQYLPTLSVFAAESSRILTQDGVYIMVIDHPGHALFARAQELIGVKDGKFITSASYFTDGIRKKKSLWDKAVLEYYHRPIKNYINVFAQYYSLEEMDETTQDGETPRILGIKWKNRC